MNKINEIEIKIIIRPGKFNSSHDETDSSIIRELERNLDYSFSEITGHEIDEIEVEVNRNK
jgi:hypothetical protein